MFFFRFLFAIKIITINEITSLSIENYENVFFHICHDQFDVLKKGENN